MVLQKKMQNTSINQQKRCDRALRHYFEDKFLQKVIFIAERTDTFVFGVEFSKIMNCVHRLHWRIGSHCIFKFIQKIWTFTVKNGHQGIVVFRRKKMRGCDFAEVIENRGACHYCWIWLGITTEIFYYPATLRVITFTDCPQ